MNDRELLELAAKAAGHTLQWYVGPGFHEAYIAGRAVAWNPLTDDGDALRLAVKLGFVVDTNGMFSRVSYPFGEVIVRQPHYDDPCAATRRAIVRAAAAIAKESA